jgi:hypothetical protein
VSAGVYGWAADEVADVAARAVHAWAGRAGRAPGDDDAGGLDEPGRVALVRFVLFSPPLLSAFERALG